MSVATRQKCVQPSRSRTSAPCRLFPSASARLIPVNEHTPCASRLQTSPFLVLLMTYYERATCHQPRHFKIAFYSDCKIHPKGFICVYRPRDPLPPRPPRCCPRPPRCPLPPPLDALYEDRPLSIPFEPAVRALPPAGTAGAMDQSSSAFGVTAQLLSDAPSGWSQSLAAATGSWFAGCGCCERPLSLFSSGWLGTAPLGSDQSLTTAFPGVSVSFGSDQSLAQAFAPLAADGCDQSLAQAFAPLAADGCDQLSLPLTTTETAADWLESTVFGCDQSSCCGEAAGARPRDNELGSVREFFPAAVFPRCAFAVPTPGDADQSDPFAVVEFCDQSTVLCCCSSVAQL